MTRAVSGSSRRNAATDGRIASSPARLRTRGHATLSLRPPKVSCRGVVPQ